MWFVMVLSSVFPVFVSEESSAEEQIGAEKEEGQTLAIVTGAVSIVIGVSFLLLPMLLLPDGIQVFSTTIPKTAFICLCGFALQALYLLLVQFLDSREFLPLPPMD